MVQGFSPLLSTLLSWVGISVADNDCVLSQEQLRQLGAHILALYPPDTQTAHLTGGSLANLELSSHSTLRPVRIVQAQADVSFLVIAGPQGGIALLAIVAKDLYYTRLISDLKGVDRVILVLSQYSNDLFEHDGFGSAAVQRVFITKLITTLLINPVFQTIDLAALLPTETRWIDLARALSDHADIPSMLTLPAVTQFLHDNGCTRALLGQLDHDQQLHIIAADSDTAPATLATDTGILIDVLHSKQLTSALPESSPFEQQKANSANAWAQGDVLTVLPIAGVGKIWGMLLAASERPLSRTACANLEGLGALLANLLPPKMTIALADKTMTGAQQWRQSLEDPPWERAVNEPAAPIMRKARRQQQQPVPNNLGLLNHVSDGIIITNTRGRIIECNQLAMRQFDLTDEVIGTSLFEHNTETLGALLSDAVVGEYAESYEVVLPDGQRARIIVTETGPDLWAFIIQMPLQFYSVECRVDDLTFRYNRIDRSADEPMTSLVAAQAQPKDQMSALSGYPYTNESFLTKLAAMMHMPLATIRDLTFQIPTAGALNEQQSYLLGQIVKHNSDLFLIFKDLVAIEQIREQPIEHAGLVQIDKLIVATLDIQSAEINRRGQTLITSTPSNLPPVYGDKERLGRVLSILLDNAIKYSPPGAFLQIIAFERDQRVAISIQNTGISLPPDELERVFEPFYRAPSSSKPGIPGRGLGLTIARTIIEGHGGKIWVKSQPDQVTIFAFYVPCALSTTA
jgi:signal transduction histidine kinase